jgi:anti-sigma B factor antagonist
MVERPQFGVEILWPRVDLALIVVDGELDLCTAPKLEKALEEGIEKGAQRLVVDLSAVPFIDSSGLGALISGLKRLRPRGGSLDLVCSRANVVRTFKVTGLLGVLGLYAKREEALAATSNTPG